MLTRDSRNFHGWGYRRIVVTNLESQQLNGQNMSRAEYDYTTKKIGENLSNFSAWHTRSRLILGMLELEKATDAERRAMLDEEIELIHRALFDPFDQSLWFYHQHLMCTFDPDTSQNSMAPNLTVQEKLEYVDGEKDYIQDLLEDSKDCKWVYQALIDCAIIEKKLGRSNGHDPSQIEAWLASLERLDPLRAGRWQDARARLIN